MANECACRNLPEGDHFAACPHSKLHLPDRMAAMLRRLEWAGECNGCPECGGYEPGANQGISPALEGHAVTCDLATLLRDLP